MSDVLTMERDGVVLVLRLNRPDKLNAMNDAMMQSLLAALDIAGRDEDVRALVVTGEGRAFSAGGDIAALESADEIGFSESIHLYMRLAQAFRSLGKISIAAVNMFSSFVQTARHTTRISYVLNWQ